MRGDGSRKIRVQLTAHTRRIGKNGSNAPQTHGKKKGKEGRDYRFIEELCIRDPKKCVKRSHDLLIAVDCGNETQHEIVDKNHYHIKLLLLC